MHFGVDGVKELIADAKPYPVKGLYRLSDYPEFGPIKTFSVGWPELDPYYKPTPCSSPSLPERPKVGKSKWTCAILKELLTAYDQQAAVASFEMPVMPFLRNEIRLQLRSLTRNVHEADAWIEKRLVFIDQDPRDEEEEATLDLALERAADAVVRDNISWLSRSILWNELDSDKEDRETGEEAQRRQIKSLKRFAKSYGVGVIVVCHPTKSVNMPNGKIREPNLTTYLARRPGPGVGDQRFDGGERLGVLGAVVVLDEGAVAAAVAPRRRCGSLRRRLPSPRRAADRRRRHPSRRPRHRCRRSSRLG